jgi:hypothetical protein
VAPIQLAPPVVFAESSEVTAVQTALDRQTLLVPVPQIIEDERPVPEVREILRPPDGGAPAGQDHPSSTYPVVAQAHSALIVLAVLSIGLVVQLAWISNWVHRSAQVSLFNRFRTELALGTGPIGAVKPPLPMGAPMALIQIPSIGVKQVVVEGTTGSVLTSGPGHLRSTVFPGGAGDSIILGRAASFGGPFGRIHTLKPGARISVTTQVGISNFRVIGVRYAGGRIPRIRPGSSRLTLETASGHEYVPSGVVTVTADKIGPPLASSAPPVSSVLPSELPLGTDTSTLWALFFWLEALALALAGAVWTWRRRGHAQAWIVFTPPLLLIWLFTTDQIVRLLPNLL